MAKKEKRPNAFKRLWLDFKKFITRGNILDLSVGVVIGGAFNAIVNAFTKILLSVCTWMVPGGLNGLVTVLPAVNPAQSGLNPAIGLDQQIAVDELQTLAESFALQNYTAEEIASNTNLIESAKSTILSKYTQYGTTYVYNQSAIIDWGSIINAIISFIIIALTLFVIIKVFAYVTKKHEELKAKLVEQYYVAHPEERPAPPVPGAPVVTEKDILVEIRDLLKKQNETKE
jgi:large-conductance mechanosensitive channel